MADVHARTLAKPRAVDYVMWGFIGLTMIAVATAALTIESVVVRLIAVAYIALGGYLLWRRWRALR